MFFFYIFLKLLFTTGVSGCPLRYTSDDSSPEIAACGMSRSGGDIISWVGCWMSEHNTALDLCSLLRHTSSQSLGALTLILAVLPLCFTELVYLPPLSLSLTLLTSLTMSLSVYNFLSQLLSQFISFLSRLPLPVYLSVSRPRSGVAMPFGCLTIGEKKDYNSPTEVTDKYDLGQIVKS